jgi:hypothetical protein
MDLAFRRIVYHDASDHDYTSIQAVHISQMAINLEQSIDSKTNQNQVSERLNRTF